MTQFICKYTHQSIKRTTPRTSSGSMTVEAALAIPVFLFASLCLIYLLEIHAIQATVRMAAHTAAKQTAEQMAVVPEMGASLFRSRFLRTAGTQRLDRSIISGGSGGICCGKTRINAQNQIEVCVEYKLRLPFPQFLGAPVRCEETFLVKGWTGYEKNGRGPDETEGTIVYITDTATVYHTDYQCSHLQLSIQFVPAESLKGMRNYDGGRYHACEKCTGFLTMGGVYVTDYGNKYHTSIRCGGLKRTVYAVPKSEVEGKGRCSRCAH